MILSDVSHNTVSQLTFLVRERELLQVALFQCVLQAAGFPAEDEEQKNDYKHLEIKYCLRVI